MYSTSASDVPVARSSYAKEHEPCDYRGEVLLPWIGRHHVHRAGLLTSGYKRCLSRLPARKCEALLHALKAVTLALCIRIDSDRRGDKLLASYSSATASELHRLPYSAWLTSSHPGHPVATATLLLLEVVYETATCNVKSSVGMAEASAATTIHAMPVVLVYSSGGACLRHALGILCFTNYLKRDRVISSTAAVLHQEIDSERP